MWRDDKGSWFDWDILNSKHREYFYISNIVPLWTESYNMSKKSVATAVLGYLKDQHVIENDYSISYNGKIKMNITNKYLITYQYTQNYIINNSIF